MSPRWLVPLIPVVAFGQVATAQIAVKGYAAGTLGISDVSHRIFVQTSPPTDRMVTDHRRSLIASLSVGAEFSKHAALDAIFRSGIGIGRPFRVLTLGPAATVGENTRVRARAGIGRVQGFQAVDCVASAAPCPRYVSEWVTGIDVTVGVEFRRGSRWTLGPSFWWAESTDSTTYRSLGVGVLLRYR